MIPILAYHKVSERPRAGEPSWMAVPPETFERQIATLAGEGYRTIDPAALLAALGGTPPPARSLLVTFDDGYEDNATQALPVLARHGFTAIVFLIGDYLSTAPSSERPCPRAVPDVPMLDDAQIRSLRDAGWSFGSHGMSHRRLPDLPEDEVRWELEGLARAGLADGRATDQAPRLPVRRHGRARGRARAPPGTARRSRCARGP
ncbi:MAG: polysaccharide deacetylase family protein [Acidobacteriota bacterium]